MSELTRAVDDLTKAGVAFMEVGDWFADKPLRRWLIKVISGGRITFEVSSHVETTTSAAPIPAYNALAGTAYLGRRNE